MAAKWLAFSIWVGVATALCWSWASSVDWSYGTALLFAAVPLLLWRAQHFGERVYGIGKVLVVGVVVVPALFLAADWLGWIKGAFQGEIQLMSAVLMWMALVALGYLDSFEQSPI